MLQVVLAKKNASHSGGGLFHATNVTNLTVLGYGATWQMRKLDYNDPTKYTHSDDRHCLSLHGARDVSVLGLTLASSGGDGIYIRGGIGGNDGTRQSCKNILIKVRSTFLSC